MSETKSASDMVDIIDLDDADVRDVKRRQLLAQAFAGVLVTTAALLTVWRGSLAAGRAAELTALETKGLRLGVAITMPKDRWVIRILLTDAAGQAELFDTIEQIGELNSTLN